MTVPTLLVTGPVGVGKSTVAAAVSDRLALQDVPHAFADMDCFSHFHPRPPDDRFGSRLTLEALRQLWRLWRAAGADRLVLAQVVEERSWLREFEDAVPGAVIFVVRLTAALETIHDRIRGRESGPLLQWHLDRAAELDALWAERPLEDALVDTEGRDVDGIALEVLTRTGWVG